MTSGMKRVRAFFYVDREQRLIILHAILKKTRATPRSVADLARRRMRAHQRSLE